MRDHVAWRPVRQQIVHRETHRSLLRPSRRWRAGTVDAVVVSASRSAEHMRPAMRLSRRLNCRFIALCSRLAHGDEIRRLAEREPGLRFAVIVVPERYRHELISFRTDSSPGAGVGRLGDLSVKRNLGLLLGYRAGWKSILFLDDDIESLRPRLVRRAAGTLKPGGAVGLPAYKFADNSVVCHANRRSGHNQDVFVSGSALLVDCARVEAFFPRVYNEDWLFLAHAVARRAVSKIGSVRQLPYDPYEVKRARSEEFGDVLAEGLMAALHVGGLAAAAEAGYWEEFLVRRKEFISGIAGRIEERRTERRRTDILAALDAAEDRRAQISGIELAGYVADWRADLECWQQRLAKLTRPVPFGEILKKLKLDRATVSPNFDHGGAPVGSVPSGDPTGPASERLVVRMPSMGLSRRQRAQPVLLGSESMVGSRTGLDNQPPSTPSAASGPGTAGHEASTPTS